MNDDVFLALILRTESIERDVRELQDWFPALGRYHDGTTKPEGNLRRAAERLAALSADLITLADSAEQARAPADIRRVA